MYILGLTGSSGVGKSLAAHHLEQRSFVHVDADKVARLVVLPNTPCLKKLAEVFGRDIINIDGSLNRKKLAELAFEHGRVGQLGAVTHPFIIEEIRRILEGLDANGTNFAVLDAPALYESGAEKMCDSVMAVTSPREYRIQRIMERDGLTEKLAKSRIDAQPDDDYYTSKADFIIKNDRLSAAFFEEVDRVADLILRVGGMDGI